MSDRDLPEWLVQALAAQLEQTPREPLRRAQQHLSEVYRSGGHSNLAIRSREEALAYAIVRMPATYAACASAFGNLTDADPAFAPSSMLDIGAGPGTATFAAAEHWPSSRSFELFEPHPHMAAISQQLGKADPQARAYRHSKSSRISEMSGSFDLVVASYVLTEQDEKTAASLVRDMLRLTTGHLVLVEPGTTRGYQRLMAARKELAALGATVAAPCPANRRCPLPQGDWCHFKVRLNRRKEHRIIKGADAPFEDEPYSYLILTKTTPAATNTARILREPAIVKAGIDLTLCTASGLEKRTIPRRNKAAYKAAKRWSAGDAVRFDRDLAEPEEPNP